MQWYMLFFWLSVPFVLIGVHKLDKLIEARDRIDGIVYKDILED
jgi:hypothetical protein